MARDLKPAGTGIIIVTLLLAGWLSLLPWPDRLSLFRPEWLTLVLIYWVIALPYRVGVFWGFFAGLFQDVLVGAVLGQHALAFALVAWLAQASYKRLRVFPPLQQSLVVFLLVGVAVMVSYTVQDAAGRAHYSPLLMQLSAAASALVWRPVFALLRGVRQQFLVR
ncbi:MAG: rod shape-determining protein MreD [Alcanivoracaceae bacterium]